MKTITTIFLLFIFVNLVIGQEVRVTVKNSAPFDRTLETIEIPWNQLHGKMENNSISVYENDKEIVSQIIDANNDGIPELLLFQSGFKGNESKTYVLKSNPDKKETATLTHAKYILPRKDVAWENDRIAFRIYGGPLAGDVYNGLDVWVKRVRYQIMDKWYDGDSLKGKKRISYHIDHGEGADMFDVGKSLGAGACALWIDGKLDQPGLFVKQQIVASGPIRTEFIVWYEKDSVGGLPFKQEATYTLDEGKNLNRIQVRYSGDQLKDDLQIAAGLVKRKNTSHFANEKEGWLSLWGAVNADTANGSLGTGIVMPPGVSTSVIDDTRHCLITVPTHSDSLFTYYAGAGWTRSGDFSSADDWHKYLSMWAESLRFPLEVEVSAR